MRGKPVIKPVVFWLLVGQAIMAGDVPGKGMVWLSLDEAWRAAQEQSKPLLVYVTLPGCAYYRAMEQRTFTDRRVQEKRQTCFVIARVDANQYRNWAERWGAQAYPTLLVIAPDKKLVARHAGFVSSDGLVERISAWCRERATLPASGEGQP